VVEERKNELLGRVPMDFSIRRESEGSESRDEKMIVKLIE
jgi:hypothetical protein